MPNRLPDKPSLEEPTTPQPPLPPADDTRAPQVRTATGYDTGAAPDARAQQGEYLTTAQGVRLPDSDHSLKAGDRGPTLLQDHHLREKITHFDHERIPERVVHARGTGAHGVFKAYGSAEKVSRAAFLKKDVETPVFVRFSTVLGSRGSADTPRDTRGFAVKFYTEEGNFDLVGNNIPVFFIQDGIKFPDVVHAAKPEPDREIPQAASAHDTFWDFVSLHTEAQHHTLWNMSDRALPLSLRTMEGFGVHTFRLVDEDGKTVLIKWHWKPVAGVHSTLWEEAQLIMGGDPDFQRRDLADAIEAGHYPQWELGIQVMPDTEDQTFEGIDLLDPTKLVPEELAPVQPVGIMTLDANPTNFFAEVEQVMFNPGHLVPGIDVVNDALLQARLFSYVDTQITRLGGPNFSQLPINRPHVDVNDNLRDGFHQHAVPTGVAPYRPNSLGGGCPFHAGADVGGFVEVPAAVAASQKVRAIPRSFDDHYSQARMFFRSLSPVEQDHTVSAYSFELGKCTSSVVRERQLQCLANIDADLCAGVAAALGMPAPKPTVEVADAAPSAALSQVGKEFPVDGRKLGIVCDADSDLAAVTAMVGAATKAKLVPFVVGPHGGTLQGKGGEVEVDKTFATARSVEFDAVVLAGPIAPAADAAPTLDARNGDPDASAKPTDPRIALLLGEAFRHCKAIGAVSAEALGDLPQDAPGVVVADAKAMVGELTPLLAKHRVWDRFPTRAR
ncbi:catalase [Arsenicicoccus sp. oral taxon 190]|uniref:catalase n=1 Tax=Arsenicicoccus sp. oral taxon 190 TaxID=1658671 RepID=UPI00067A0CE2|nr:catalase [Arsenicicoccus sp. oral taxon 190]AKT50316.1 catalase [Arsenicicoccus sp. oral taxon 190]